MFKQISKKFITDLIKFLPQETEDLLQAKRQLAKKHGTTIIANSVILKKYRQFFKGKLDKQLVRLLRKREIRTLGVFTVLRLKACQKVILLQSQLLSELCV